MDELRKVLIDFEARNGSEYFTLVIVYSDVHVHLTCSARYLIRQYGAPLAQCEHKMTHTQLMEFSQH